MIGSEDLVKRHTMDMHVIEPDGPKASSASGVR
jgi:hypothetical protein